MIERKIHKIDATDISFGRLSTKIATLLRGKHKTTYTPNIDNGDFVVIENIDSIKITGDKLNQKEYIHHSGWIGGLKRRLMKNVSKEEVLRTSVYEMLPNNKTRKNIIKRLSFGKKQ
jgi:large subunit ribosomal protein L13